MRVTTTGLLTAAMALAFALPGLGFAQDRGAQEGSARDRAALDEDAAANWPRYARDPGGTRFSPLDQITTRNVGQLQQAWSFALRPEGGAGLLGGSVPIVIDGVMYVPLGNAVVALEADSGKEIWRHEVTDGLVRRAVSYWPGDGTVGPRIFYNGNNTLIALNPATGQLDTAFGTAGKVDIGGTPYSYPPSVWKNVLVVGSNTQENSFGPSGNSRAFDARTGKKLWEFNTVPQEGEVGHETWLDGITQGRSGNNMWIWYTTFDPETNLLYMTIGGPSPNYFGGLRPGNNLFGNSIVAVDLNTGEYKWHFQTIHHDLWDWDLPAPPVLVDVVKDGKRIPALAETGKPGFMYILDRRTGEPVHGVFERPVASGDVPGEWYSPTQPVPVKPEQLNRGSWDKDDIVTIADSTQAHVDACHALLDSYGGNFYNAGSFTPFFMKKEIKGKPFSSYNMPHNGGSVWGGSAADPRKGVVFVNTTEGGSIGWIEERDPKGNYGNGTATSDQKYDRGSLVGPGAYSGFIASFEGPDGQKMSLPCIRPPWGRMIAVDANTGEIKWATRLGISEGLPKNKQNTGANNASGGPIATAGGLVFIAATSDRFLRAFDSDTGRILWEKRTQYAGLTLPMTYQGKDGRQYVALMTTGNGGPETRGADGKPLNQEALVAFALPR